MAPVGEIGDHDLVPQSGTGDLSHDLVLRHDLEFIVSLAVLLFVPPLPELKGYITKIWLFEGDNGLPDNNIVPPNARPKVIIPHRADLDNYRTFDEDLCRRRDLFYWCERCSGGTDDRKSKTGSIGLEFTTAAAYKFFRQPMHDMANDLFSFHDCFGEEGLRLQQDVSSRQDPYDKVQRVQEFLLYKLRSIDRVNRIVDYSIEMMSRSHGLIEIRELERKTGYTKRVSRSVIQGTSRYFAEDTLDDLQVSILL